MKKIVPKDARLIPENAEKVFSGIVYDVYHWPQEMYDGNNQTFEMLKRKDTTVAICVVDGKIIVLDESQPHRGRVLTFPGGRAEHDDESAQSALQREVLEETGYSFKSWKHLVTYQPHTKIEWFVHLYLATNVADKVEPRKDAGEQIELLLLDYDDVSKRSKDREGFLGEATGIFVEYPTLEQLLAAPEFEGMELDR